jgi:hypothetical protein
MERLPIMTREKLHTLYLESQKKKRTEIAKQIFDDIRKRVIEYNERGETLCSVIMDKAMDEEMVENVVYNIQSIFCDSSVSSMLHHDDKYLIRIDWSLPTYVIKPGDNIN